MGDIRSSGRELSFPGMGQADPPAPFLQTMQPHSLLLPHSAGRGVLEGTTGVYSVQCLFQGQEGARTSPGII